MRMFKDFVTPTSIGAARAELKRLGSEGMALAGATSLLFLRHKEPKVAVDLSRAGLSGIRRDGGQFVIGSMSTVSDLRNHREAGWVLDRVAAGFVTQQVRNQSTLGGNIVRVFAWADFPAALLALDASMSIQGDEARRVGADEFFSGQPIRLFKVDDLLASVSVPALSAGQGFGYHKQVRVASDYSQATVAALLTVQGGRITAARLGLGAATSFPCRLLDAERALIGQKGSEKLFRDAASQLGERNWRSTAGFTTDYIRHVAEVTVRDALAQAWREAAG